MTLKRVLRNLTDGTTIALDREPGVSCAYQFRFEDAQIVDIIHEGDNAKIQYNIFVDGNTIKPSLVDFPQEGRVVITFSRPLTGFVNLMVYKPDAFVCLPPTPTNSVTPTRTVTPTVTTTVTPTPTSSNTPTPSVTASITPTVTSSVTPSITPEITPTVTRTQTVTPSVTSSITPTITPTASITPSVTASITPTITPSFTPSSTVTPTITPTMTVTPSVTTSLNAVSLDFDYAVLRFIWTTPNGTDLDIRVDITDPSRNVIVGADRNTGDGNFLLWGGDNQTQVGQEALLVDFLQLKAAYPTQTQFITRLRTFWYGVKLDGNLRIVFQSYRGGVMQQTTGNDFINVGGTLVDNKFIWVNSPTQGGLELDGDFVANLVFDTSTNRGELIGLIPAVTPTPTPTATVTRTVAPSLSPTPSPTPDVSPSISRTPNATPTITPTSTPLVTISVTPSITQSPVTPTPTRTNSPTPDVTKSATPTITPTVTATVSVTASVTPTISFTPTNTPTLSLTPTITPTISVTPSPGASTTPTNTPTLTPGFTPTPTRTVTATPTVTATITPTRTFTPTPTRSVTPTPSFGPTPDTVSLLHFDGADGSTSFIDDTGKVWSASGNAAVTTTNARFGSGAGSFDGSGDFITSGTEADFGFGTGDFTIEAFIRPQSFPATNYVIAALGPTWLLYYNNFRGLFVWNGSVNVLQSSDGLVQQNVYQHVAWVRQSGVMSLYLDGVLRDSETNTTDFGASNAIRIGASFASQFNLAALVDEFRVSNSAKYTSNFTPPDGPFIYVAPQPTPTPTATNTATRTPTPTPSFTPSPTPTPTPAIPQGINTFNSINLDIAQDTYNSNITIVEMDIK